VRAPDNFRLLLAQFRWWLPKAGTCRKVLPHRQSRGEFGEYSGIMKGWIKHDWIKHKKICHHIRVMLIAKMLVSFR
jgi:hypothetical protein